MGSSPTVRTRTSFSGIGCPLRGKPVLLSKNWSEIEKERKRLEWLNGKLPIPSYWFCPVLKKYGVKNATDELVEKLRLRYENM